MIEQLVLPGMNENWGGRRRRAGRKAVMVERGGKLRRKHTSHAKRRGICKQHPLLVTMRMREGLPSLRDSRVLAVFEDAVREVCALGELRITHFCLLGNHLHLICETEDAGSFARGMSSLKVRLSRRWNRLWRLTGQAWEARAHVPVLWLPTQVRNAIRYVLNNAFKHACEARGTLIVRDDGRGPYSSGMHFDGRANLCPISISGSIVAQPGS